MTIVTGNLKVLCSREEDRLLDKKIPHVYHVWRFDSRVDLHMFYVREAVLTFDGILLENDGIKML